MNSTLNKQTGFLIKFRANHWIDPFFMYTHKWNSKVYEHFYTNILPVVYELVKEDHVITRQPLIELIMHTIFAVPLDEFVDFNFVLFDELLEYLYSQSENFSSEFLKVKFKIKLFPITIVICATLKKDCKYDCIATKIHNDRRCFGL